MGKFGMPLPVKVRVLLVSVILKTLFIFTLPGTVSISETTTLSSSFSHGVSACVSVLPMSWPTMYFVPSGPVTGTQAKMVFFAGALMGVPAGADFRIFGGEFPFQPEAALASTESSTVEALEAAAAAVPAGAVFGVGSSPLPPPPGTALAAM